MDTAIEDLSKDNDDIFDAINNDPHNARSRLIAYLKSQTSLLNTTDTKSIDCAYRIAGLAATDFARTLDPNDPIDEIFTIAGELEINPPDADELRKELLEKIQAL